MFFSSGEGGDGGAAGVAVGRKERTWLYLATSYYVT